MPWEALQSGIGIFSELGRGITYHYLNCLIYAKLYTLKICKSMLSLHLR